MTGNFYRGLSRGRIRDEFVEYVRIHQPQFTVEEIHPEHLLIDRPGLGSHQVFLENLFALIESMEPEASADDRQNVYGKFSRALDSGELLQSMGHDSRRDHIKPRLLHREHVASMEQQTGLTIPNIPIERTPLCIGFVIDLPDSVAFVNTNLQHELGLELQDLHDLAIEHLDDGAFGQALGEMQPSSLMNVSTGDSFDASRALLIPKYLKPGESVVILVPDRDCLVILRSDAPNRFEMMAQLASIPAGIRPLYAVPIEVTCDGFRAVETDG